ncbi:hypothetical protein AVEN_127236-1 [Araneus ventricosus]|uniref:Uncharacterized protein n=1 Tax=Araneus ventricosus TaxID=182803 RepID=A0A4Y2VMD2_ARAVE|nr:hypothetical protein AVEN_133405-1 [Araneus ventricosus]GBO25801.1 hypothetical protein AVEN_102311-1 [Araneus ventricosus]GBO34295.1 hypothetical protein AVEN_125212-1 [Araneus ventricosus]GBO34300.1 hypothetical protein AVEN_127236-1 [Araneus ventricosus]
MRTLMIIPNECFYAVHLKRCVEACLKEFKNPWYEPCKLSSTDLKPDPATKFNHKLLVDYAIEHEISDAYRLMYEYAHLGNNCDRSPSKITNDHEEEHKEHFRKCKALFLLS